MILAAALSGVELGSRDSVSPKSGPRAFLFREEIKLKSQTFQNTFIPGWLKLTKAFKPTVKCLDFQQGPGRIACLLWVQKSSEEREPVESQARFLSLGVLSIPLPKQLRVLLAGLLSH